MLPADPSIPADVDARPFVDFHLTVGDRWRDGRVHRSDDVDLGVIVSGVTDGAPERRLAASDTSTVVIAWDNDRGTLRFGGLVDAETGAPVAAPLGTLAGTISWVCGDAALPAGAAEFAEAACDGARYLGCVSDLTAAMAAAPGTEVAICEAAEDVGAVVPSRRPTHTRPALATVKRSVAACCASYGCPADPSRGGRLQRLSQEDEAGKDDWTSSRSCSGGMTCTVWTASFMNAAALAPRS